MRTLYHGTDPVTASSLKACRIDVSIGGGEFGQGFYLGSSKRLAKRRAFHKSEGHQGTAKAALNAKTENTFFITFNTTSLHQHYKTQKLCLSESIQLYKELKSKNQTKTYIAPHGIDAIKGPIVGTGRYYDIIQYKFQSHKSQLMLNGLSTTITVKRGVL
jgi:hypothetical protein